MKKITPDELEEPIIGLMKEIKSERNSEDIENYWLEILGEFLNKGINPDKKVYDTAKEGQGVIRSRSIDSDPPFTGIINREEPESGGYRGMSLVLFPNPEEESGSEIMLCFGIGTNGLGPDETILSSIGHRRRLKGLSNLSRDSLECDIWVKSQIDDLTESVPQMAKDKLGIPEGFESVFSRYGEGFLYTAHILPEDLEKAAEVFYWHLLVYASERNWRLKGSHKNNVEALEKLIQSKWRTNPSKEEIKELLKKRHFVVLQGPPGTGKTMVAEEIAKSDFFSYDPKSQFVQFHPNTTYESFVRGIEPDFSSEEELVFKGANGPLAEVCDSAKADEEKNQILVIDEINRANLGKVLGEAIRLFESSKLKEEGEVGPIRTTYSIYEDGFEKNSLILKDNVYVLGTMNTADRSIAILDFAIRRRFAFLTMWPDRTVIENENEGEVKELALEYYDKVYNVFFESANKEDMHLQPGHSYFLADNEDELNKKMKYEVAPLLKEYLMEGRLQESREEIEALISDFGEKID